MSKPYVMTSGYWSERIERCGGDLQRAMFSGSPDEFAEHHRRQMLQVQQARIGMRESVIDVGCGYGRLLNLMPEKWSGDYLGVDVADKFIQLSKIMYPNRQFTLYDGVTLPVRDKQFRWAVSVWVKTMIVRECGEDAWTPIEAEMRRVAMNVLIID